MRVNWTEVCKFLAGAAFVNAGVLFYLYLSDTSVPVLGTSYVPALLSMLSIPRQMAYAPSLISCSL
jgi:hypothetical protein